MWWRLFLIFEDKEVSSIEMMRSLVDMGSSGEEFIKVGVRPKFYLEIPANSSVEAISKTLDLIKRGKI